MQIFKPFLLLIILLSLLSCTDESIIYENDDELDPNHKIQIHEVKIFEETDNRLSLDFTYTYENSIPAEEIKLYVLPDHGYWSTNPVKIFKGKNRGRAVIGIYKTGMEKDEIKESATSILRFRFDHYPPGKFNGNVWGVDVNYKKNWKMEE